MTTQKQAFIEKYIRDVETKREDILKQEDKNPEEIQKELEEFNNSQVTEKELDILGDRFSNFQVRKENKHFKAWLKGEKFFTYLGQKYPVLTERFLRQSKSIKDIVKVEDDGKGEG